MSENKKRILAFVLTELFLAFIAWLAGFDFDQRNPGVAVAVLTAVCFGAFIGLSPLLDE